MSSRRNLTRTSDKGTSRSQILPTHLVQVRTSDANRPFCEPTRIRRFLVVGPEYQWMIGDTRIDQMTMISRPRIHSRRSRWTTLDLRAYSRPDSAPHHRSSRRPRMENSHDCDNATGYTAMRGKGEPRRTSSPDCQSSKRPSITMRGLVFFVLSQRCAKNDAMVTAPGR